MENNIWTVIEYKDLYNLIQHDNLVFLTIVLPTTNSKIKIKLRKYIKKKSKTYRDVLFIYHELLPNNYNRLKPLLTYNEEEFPKMYCLLGGSIIFKATPIDITDFDKISELLENIHLQLSQKNQNNETNNEDNIDVNTDILPDNLDNQGELDMNLDLETQKNTEFNKYEINKPPIDLMTEQRKLMDKIKMFMRHRDMYNITFIKDISKRKRLEEKYNNSDSSSDSS